MIDLYYWPTPNGHKITLFLEEADLPYKIIPINISKGEQFDEKFLEISPNNKVPAIVDHTPKSTSGPLCLFESGAILLYLAEKTGHFLSADEGPRFDTLQWLFWQVGGLGPMAGQNHHFVQYAPEKIPYAIDRYVNETNRLYGVMDRRLENRPYLAGGYSIADMACFPWIVSFEKQNIDLDQFPNVRRWFEQIQARPAVERAYERGAEINSESSITEESRRILFGQTAETISKYRASH